MAIIRRKGETMTNRRCGILLADVGIDMFHVGIESRLVFVFFFLFPTFLLGFVGSVSPRKYNDVALVLFDQLRPPASEYFPLVTVDRGISATRGVATGNAIYPGAAGTLS